jgi:hypothetical protein
VKVLTQLCTEPELQQTVAIFTRPGQIYQVLKVQGKAAAIWCGGQHIAWLPVNQCTDARISHSDISLAIPSFLEPFAPGDTRRFRYKMVAPMPLAEIPYASEDYRVMYQWIGDAAHYRPNVIGYVRDVQIVGTRSESQSETRQRLFWNSHTVGAAETINLYQLDVEDLQGIRHSAAIHQRARYIPQRGDFVVLWLARQHEAAQLIQGIRRDQRNIAIGSVLMPRQPEMLREGLITRFIVE